MSHKRLFTVLFLLAGAFAVGVVGLLLGARLPADAKEAIDRASSIIGFLTTCLAGGTALAGYYRRVDLARFFKRGRRAEYLEAGEPIVEFRERADALVIPVSHKTQPEWLIRQLKPKWVSLLYTERSKPEAISLVRDFGATDILFLPDENGIANDSHKVASPDDIRESKALVGFYLEQLLAKGVQRSKILVDTTGGKVPMSIGAFQAAEERKIATVYLKGTRPETNRAGSVDYWIKDPKDPSDGVLLYMSNPAADEPS
jgi:hypothetical protein